jgi:hypothetical protein
MVRLCCLLPLFSQLRQQSRRSSLSVDGVNVVNQIYIDFIVDLRSRWHECFVNIIAKRTRIALMFVITRRKPLRRAHKMRLFDLGTVLASNSFSRQLQFHNISNCVSINDFIHLSAGSSSSPFK